MIRRIKKLDQKVSNKIAAGEVVERPASVVKEIIENSIDALASQITVEIKDAGKSYIRVSDNGIGIHREDIDLAFERHATSKIYDDKEIYNVKSLGFRGEALASISSVSNVEVITKSQNDTMGIKAILKNGKIIHRQEVGCPAGTTLIVKDLFYNIPARYKFLKSNSAETNNISNIVNKLALSHPEISFKYIIDNKIIFSTPGDNDIKKTVLTVYGKEIVKNLIEIETVNDELEIKGYISNINCTRGNRQLQIIFVNGRYVRSKVLTEAIDLAYKSLLPINRFPLCFLYLNIPSNKIDVNIHPAKTEIRFYDEKRVKMFLYDLIKKNLLNADLVPNICIEDKGNIQNINKSNNMANKIYADSDINEQLRFMGISKNTNSEEIILENSNKYSEVKLNQSSKSNTGGEDISKITDNNLYKSSKIEEYKEQDIITNIEKSLRNIYSSKNCYIDEDKVPEKSKGIFEGMNIIGQLFSTYIICEKDQAMYLIDQHAAHERILFEKFMKSFVGSKIISQILLEPIIIELNYLDKKILFENEDIFLNLGYKIEDFGYNTIILREVPMMFGLPVAKSFFLEVLENIEREFESNYEFKIDKIVQMSCKKAIKANDNLEKVEITNLFKELKELENPYTCPHGRPIIISISKTEIEKKFLRI